MLRNLVIASLACAIVWADGAAGLKWNTPSGWKKEDGSRPMRAATYAVPAAAGDTEGGECVAYYFGPGQGGSAEANVQRWTGQLEGAKPEVKKRTVHGLPVTTVDASGTYTGMGGPMAKAKTSKPGYRLLGAIVEGPEGSVFFKLTGPAKTIAANQKVFDQLVNSLSK